MASVRFRVPFRPPPASLARTKYLALLANDTKHARLASSTEHAWLAASTEHVRLATSTEHRMKVGLGWEGRKEEKVGLRVDTMGRVGG